MKKFATQQWNTFDTLSRQCYVNRTRLDSGLIRMELTDELCSWDMAYSALMEAVRAERTHNSGFGREFYHLDEETGNLYDIDGWLINYFRILKDFECNEKIIAVCEQIIRMFEWEEYQPNVFCHCLVGVLQDEERFDECVDFCEKWHRRYPDNLCAVGNLVYAYVGTGNLEDALSLVEIYFDKEMEMDVESNTLFFAAELVYILTGQGEKANEVHDIVQNYMDMTYAELDRINQKLGIPRDRDLEDNNILPFSMNESSEGLLS